MTSHDPLRLKSETSARPLRSGRVVVWGGKPADPSTGFLLDGLTDVVAVAAGTPHLALTTQGALISWGRGPDQPDQQPTPPRLATDGVQAIAARGGELMALTPGGRVVSWRWPGLKEVSVPDWLSGAAAIALGAGFRVALSRSGEVFVWGDNDHGQCDVPARLDDVIAIAAGTKHCLALTRAGHVVAWGDNTHGQCQVPEGLGNVVGLACGDNHSLALTRDGRVIAWGDNVDRQCEVPSDLVGATAIAAGTSHSIAVTHQGRIRAWGDGSHGQCTVPEDLRDVLAISAHGDTSLAITTQGVWAAKAKEASAASRRRRLETAGPPVMRPLPPKVSLGYSEWVELFQPINPPDSGEYWRGSQVRDKIREGEISPRQVWSLWDEYYGNIERFIEPDREEGHLSGDFMYRHSINSEHLGFAVTKRWWDHHSPKVDGYDRVDEFDIDEYEPLKSPTGTWIWTPDQVDWSRNQVDWTRINDISEEQVWAVTGVEGTGTASKLIVTDDWMKHDRLVVTQFSRWNSDEWQGGRRVVLARLEAVREYRGQAPLVVAPPHVPPPDFGVVSSRSLATALWEALELPEGTPITDAHLTAVTQLHVLQDADEPELDLDELLQTPNITHLQLEGFRGSDLSPLSSLRELTHLTIAGHKSGVSDLTPLAALTALTSLTLRELPDLVDLSPLAHLRALNHVELEGPTKAEDLTLVTHLRIAPRPRLSRAALRSLVSLRSLTVFAPEAKLMSELVHLPRLTSLSVLSPRFKNLDSLGRLQYLTSLHLADQWDGYKFDDLTPLAALSRLEDLDIHYLAEDTSLEPLTHLPRLTKLWLRGTRNLEHLSSLTQLNELSIASSSAHDWSPLEHLINLTSLEITDSPTLKRLDHLRSLKELTRLELENLDRLASLASMEHLTSLTELVLRNLPLVEDLSPLGGLTALRDLSVRDIDRVTDVSPLGTLKALKNLTLGLNNVTQVKSLAGLTQVESLRLRWMEGVTDVDALAALPATVK